MNITIEQYNRVIDGMRTHLELHEEMAAERTGVNERLSQLLLDKQSELDLVSSIASGANITGVEDTTAMRTVRALRQAHEAALADIAKLATEISKLKTKIDRLQS